MSQHRRQDLEARREEGVGAKENEMENPDVASRTLVSSVSGWIQGTQLIMLP